MPVESLIPPSPLYFLLKIRKQRSYSCFVIYIQDIRMERVSPQER